LLERVQQLLPHFPWPCQVIVVNDGSSDDTEAIAQAYESKLPLYIHSFTHNQGLGAALAEGFRQALKRGKTGDIIISMDGDNSHPPGLMNRMIKQIQEGSDIVIASRYQYGSRIVGVNAFRRMLSRVAGMLMQALVRIRGVRDYTCGYRAYRWELIQSAFQHYNDQHFVEQKGFACMIEVLIKLKRFNPIIHEVPLILRYDLKESSSKMRIFRTINETLKMVLKSKNT